MARPLFIITCFIPEQDLQTVLPCTTHALLCQSTTSDGSQPLRNSMKTQHKGVPWSSQEAEAGRTTLTCFRAPAAGGAGEAVAGQRGCAGRRGSAAPGDSAGPWGCAAGPWGSASPSWGPRLGCSTLHDGKLEIKGLSQRSI